MSAPLPRGVGLTLMLLGTFAYLAVAVIEWRLGSAYHAGLAVALAALFVFTGRGRVSVGTALMLVAVLAYGLYRAVVGLSLLGLL